MPRAAARSRKTPPPTQKRIVIVTGFKGGTGKTTFARALREMLEMKGIACGAYDSDAENGQFYRFYKDVGEGVTRIDLLKRGGADALVNELEARGLPVVLVDLPGGAGRALETFERELSFVKLANDLGYGVTLVSVLSRTRDSVNALKLVLDFFGNRVNYVAVKNLYVGDADKFRLFDQSNTKQTFLELGGLTLELPDLNDDAYELIDEKNLPFGLAASPESPLTRAHKSRVYAWLKQVEEQIAIAGELLGVPGG